jgi:hypothetical protein
VDPSILARGQGYFAEIEAATGTPGSPGQIGTYWSEVYPTLALPGEYHDPSAFMPYSAGELPTVACDVGVDAGRWENNALYCPTDEAMAWHDIFLFGGYMNLGKFAPIAVLSHEWGHHVAKLGGLGATRVQAELQADCFAGMYAEYAEEQGFLESGDWTIAFAQFLLLGDDEYSREHWFDPNVHGSPRLRGLAFALGSTVAKAEYCIAYDEYQFEDPIVFGRYTIDVWPGVDVRHDGEHAVRLTRGNGLVTVKWIGRLASRDAIAELRYLSEEWASGKTIRWVDDQPGDAGVAPVVGGTAATRRFERTDSGEGGPTHGALLVNVLADGEAILVEASLPGLAPPTDPQWEPLADVLYTTMMGVCSTDAESALCAPQYR